MAITLGESREVFTEVMLALSAKAEALSVCP